MPLVPSWVESGNAGQPVQAPPPVAPPRRFASTRRATATLFGSNASSAARHVLGSYVRHGYGGSATAARRFGSAATAAAGLYGFLSGAPQAAPALATFNLKNLSSLSTQDQIAAIAAAVWPSNQTLDDAAQRTAMCEALAELASKEPTLDFAAMSTEHATEVFILALAFGIFETFRLDIGKTIQEKANGNHAQEQSVLSAIRSTLVEVVRGEVTRLQAQTGLNAGTSAAIAVTAIAAVTAIFEEEVR